MGGKVGDLFGRKWALIGGLVGFSAASAVGGLAQSFGVLVAARATQGVFGALLAPSALSLLTVTFAGTKDWPKAFGIFGAVAGGAGAVGLLLGGLLTQELVAGVPLRQSGNRGAHGNRRELVVREAPPRNAPFVAKSRVAPDVL